MWSKTNTTPQHDAYRLRELKILTIIMYYFIDVEREGDEK